MAHSDAELIKRTLAGDETAFGFLVDKYKGAIHALAYRKLGDFHIAEEITQDTFLKAYQKLGTLKDPARFSGWIYVIAARRCISWQRRHRLPTQSLDDVGSDQMNALAWEKYADAQKREEVHEALKSLPESERTVLTLHYLGGLTYEEIARFIGASQVTIRNRLYRARCRLKEEVIKMMSETWGTFQIPPTFTEQLVERVRDLKPTATQTGKPLAPWIAATTLAVVALLVGLGVVQSTRFQLPYSFDATESEVLVETMKAPIFEMPLPKQAITAQRDLSSTGDTGNGNQSNGSALAFAANSRKGEDAKATGWTQTNGPYGGTVLTLLATSEGTLYAGTQGAGIFRSTDGGDSWTPVNTGLPVYEDNRIPTIFSLTMMGEALYAGTGGDLFQSTDGGNSWQQVTRSKNTGVDAVAAVGNTLYIGRSPRRCLSLDGMEENRGHRLTKDWQTCVSVN